MIYLKSFSFPCREREEAYAGSIRRTCYTSFYPLGILSKRQFERIDFEPVTILYGGNGSGKSTALHVIADKTGIERESPYNRTSFFEDYVSMCRMETASIIPKGSCIITSDDVFDHMISLREFNEGIDHKREEIFDEYLDAKYKKHPFHSMDDYENLRKSVRARKYSQSRYVKEELGMNARTFSNGESAYRYFTNKIEEDKLYLLDEPENSLSAERQEELCRFIEDSARFMGCQFVISTHSPFLLSMRAAKIYNLDSDPVDVCKWTQLQNVRKVYEFFKKHERAFEGD